MKNGSIDLFTSRRRNFNRCRYWIAEDEITPTVDKYDIDQFEDGIFYANETAPETEDYETTSGDFMFTGYKVSISTTDDVSDLTVNSLVEYNDEIWRVKDIQKIKRKKQSQFSKNVSWEYFINMRR